MFAMGQHARGSLVPSLAASTTAIDAIKREPQREATGATAAPAPIDHRISYPGGGASKNIMAAIPIFQPGRSAKPHESRLNEPKT